jgi:hypothetical protein
LCWQPSVALHVSTVHGFASSQFAAGPPTHAPPAQVSPVVHRSRSSQLAALFVCVHPLAGTHESVVHGLLSLQFVGPPAPQTPAEHVSPVVHGLPSLHTPALNVTHVPAALHIWQSVRLFPPHALPQHRPSTQGRPPPHMGSRVHCPP